MKKFWNWTKNDAGNGRCIWKAQSPRRAGLRRYHACRFQGGAAFRLRADYPAYLLAGATAWPRRGSIACSWSIRRM